MVVTIRVSSLP